MRNQIEFVIHAQYALFTDPLMKLGGEKHSYHIPTYQSLKGITESIYWKPSLIWVIDAVRIMNPINMETKGVRPIEYSGGNSLANYTYLRDVRYHVKAHFIFNPYREDLAADHIEGKHYSIAKRALEAGGRRDIFLGTRECQGYVEPCSFDSGNGFYDTYDGEINFGPMIHGINYPDETGHEHMEARLWTPVMRKGIIEFIRPEDCTQVRTLSKWSMKKFDNTNLESVNNLYEELGGE